ncbi:MAG: hypothetical protein GF401_00585 [Chitinivibrionales bacterium]|nr:hypothetical protein [Chitinivibrionales bacterium]
MIYERMNRDRIRYQLEEAFFDLEQIISNIRSDRRYSELDFDTDMKHLLKHIHLASDINNISTCDTIGYSKSNRAN